MVLIVDDDEDTREMYGAGFAHAGFEPVLAANALDALRLASETSADVVITDVMLPGPMDGLTLARRLRHDPRTSGAAIIAISGRGAKRDRKDAERAGCDTLLILPCLPDDLVAEVRHVMSRRALQAAAD